jgi:hypothetical protein
MRSVVVLALCWRLAESDITLTPWIDYISDIITWDQVPSYIALDFLTKSDKPKSTSPSEIQVKNWQTTISTEEKLDVISQFEKGEQIVDIWCNVRFTHSRVSTMCDNADRYPKSAKSGPKVLRSKPTTVLIRINHTKNYRCESLTIFMH